MDYWLLIHGLTFFLDLFIIWGVVNDDKDLEIILLRQQVRILQRKVNAPPRISPSESAV
jgi:hypothetical protein